MEDSPGDACGSTKSEIGRAVIQVSPRLQSSSTAHPPPSVSLSVWAETPEGEQESQTVLVDDSNCWALIKAANQQLLLAFQGLLVAFCEEGMYYREGDVRRAMTCFDRKGTISFFDSDDGQLVNSKTLLDSSVRFLHSSSPLPSIPNHEPIIHIRTNSDFLTCSPQGDIQAAPAEALQNPTFVLLTRGIRSEAQFFWEYQGGKFLDAESNELLRREKIPGGVSKHHVMLLLRDGPVPRFAAAQNEHLLLFRREGVRLRMENGCLRCVGPPLPEGIERWIFVQKHDDFYEDFMKAFTAES